ncbi:hypothetical protein BV898_10654 [Hypsibius exemplaris]|uniref:SGNH/GDSL hydrolase family protein n=1 Tax=Hypsibius exemplaris TaxID=2072580 RepID=A0A1W0WIU1_HYPEX|nr:hypothetical protein BV898_10654 [Hypsibius exemplaris]
MDILDGDKYKHGRCSVGRMAENVRDLASSLNHKFILMIGDSRTMQLFRYIRILLNGRFDEVKLFSSADLRAEFSDAERNFSMLYYFKPLPDLVTQDIIREWTAATAPRRPDYLFYETGVWSLYHFGPQFLPTFRENVTAIADVMALTRNTTIPIWIRTLPIHIDTPSHKAGWAKTLYNRTDLLIESFGQAVEDVARQHRFTLWTSAHHVAKRNPQFYHDKIHPGLPMLRLFACQFLTALSTNTNCLD